MVWCDLFTNILQFCFADIVTIKLLPGWTWNRKSKTSKIDWHSTQRKHITGWMMYIIREMYCSRDFEKHYPGSTFNFIMKDKWPENMLRISNEIFRIESMQFHTHTHIYIYIYLFVLNVNNCVYLLISKPSPVWRHAGICRNRYHVECILSWYLLGGHITLKNDALSIAKPHQDVVLTY